ncbi:MAG: glycosyl transferase [Tardiphaga sp.]|uniref:glycosyltransferase family 4 protein n=1 Tax=Tardiphaga sp. TaxID=1926292 RepID=UPI0026174F60|nr:glycosyltransferase family 4 protein [Tardiphaga sp.]MDB5504147.1 glycosyl transferase [Tardiphaga sp.]
MNILMLTSEFAPAQGGIGTYTRELAAAATTLGARVTVVAPDYAQDTSAADSALPFAVQRFRGGLHSMRDLPAKIRLADTLLRRRRYDVVHAADWPFFIPVALARRLTPARLLMTVHGTEINETQTPLKRLAIRAAGVFGPRTEVAANSRYTRDLFRARFTIDPRHIKAIPLGVSGFWFGSGPGRDATRQAQRIAPDRVVMVTVARITRRKGHHLTLAALNALPADVRQRMTWLVIGPNGESDYVAELQRLIQTSGCDVRLLGALSNEAIRDIYGAADFFCLTGVPDSSGRVEGFGLVYLEAGATGLPSVATAIGGVSDAVLADESGLLVAPEVEAIAAAIAELAVDSDTRSILAAGASTHARTLSWERCAAETYGLPQLGEAIDTAAPEHRHAAAPGAVSA